MSYWRGSYFITTNTYNMSNEAGIYIKSSFIHNGWQYIDNDSGYIKVATDGSSSYLPCDDKEYNEALENQGK